MNAYESDQLAKGIAITGLAAGIIIGAFTCLESVGLGCIGGGFVIALSVVALLMIDKDIEKLKKDAHNILVDLQYAPYSKERRRRGFEGVNPNVTLLRK